MTSTHLFGALVDGQTLYNAYAQTCAINTLAGNAPAQGWPAVRAQLKIVESEFLEMKEGIENGDLREFRDGLADLLFTVIGMAHRAGLPLIEDLHEVVRSNLTKFDSNETDAVKTKVKYLEQGIETEYFEAQLDGKTLYVTRSARDQQVKGKNYPAGKWLKSYRFEDTQFALLSHDTLLPEIVAAAPTPAADVPVEATKLDLQPVRILCTMLGRHHRLAHIFVAMLRDAVIERLMIAHWRDGEARHAFATTGAIRFYQHLLHSEAQVQIDREQLPPAGLDWNGCAIHMSDSEWRVLVLAVEKLSAELGKDDSYLISWHSNVAQTFVDASQGALSHALAQTLAGGVMEKLFKLNSTPVFWQLHGQTDSTTESVAEPA